MFCPFQVTLFSSEAKSDVLTMQLHASVNYAAAGLFNRNLPEAVSQTIRYLYLSHMRLLSCFLSSFSLDSCLMQCYSIKVSCLLKFWTK